MSISEILEDGIDDRGFRYDKENTLKFIRTANNVCKLKWR